MLVNGRNIKLFDSMYDYVNDADLTYYEISDGKERKTPFVKGVQPQSDSNFMIYAGDTITVDGLEYTKVNFGEDDSEVGESFILSSALDEEVFMIYIEKKKGVPVYVPANGYIYPNREIAELNIQEDD